MINKTFKTPGNNDLEFRLHSDYVLSNSSNAFVMRLKNEKWEAHVFRRQAGKWTAETVDNTNLGKLWEDLTYNKVLTLTDDRFVKDRRKQFEADTIAILKNEDYYKETAITDGVSYHFELAQFGYKKRAYSYHCPKANIRLYPNIEEYYRAYAIIVHVYKYLGKPLNIC